MTAFARRSLRENQWGLSVALFTTVFAIGQSIGPVAAGAIADATGSISAGLTAAAAVLMVAALVAILQRPVPQGSC